jgi:hypothetical protein
MSGEQVLRTVREPVVPYLKVDLHSKNSPGMDENKHRTPVGTRNNSADITTTQM